MWQSYESIAAYLSDKSQQLLCVVCRHYFLETLGTLFHGKRTSVELIVRVIACLDLLYAPL